MICVLWRPPHVTRLRSQEEQQLRAAMAESVATSAARPAMTEAEARECSTLLNSMLDTAEAGGGLAADAPGLMYQLAGRCRVSGRLDTGVSL